MFHAEPLKDIENRVWPLPHYLRGQRVAIHASAKLRTREFDAAVELILDRLGLSALSAFNVSLAPGRFPTSAIIGTVEIVDCVTASDSPWFVGPYGFVLRDPRPLLEPIPCRGRLNFWTVSEAIAAQIREQERRAA